MKLKSKSMGVPQAAKQFPAGRAVANALHRKGNGERSMLQLVDQRPAAVVQRRLQEMAGRYTDMRLPPLQLAKGPAILQRQNPVTNSQAKNMQQSLARVFGGKSGDYQIDRTTGNAFPDNNGKGTTGHHGVKVTDKRDGKVYYCDFHQNGKYYTRG